MPYFTVVFDGTDHCDETIEADYYKRDEDWITFKDSSHKVVADIPEHAVRMLFRIAPPTGSAVDLLDERVKRQQFIKSQLALLEAPPAGLRRKLDEWISADQQLLLALE